MHLLISSRLLNSPENTPRPHDLELEHLSGRVEPPKVLSSEEKAIQDYNPLSVPADMTLAFMHQVIDSSQGFFPRRATAITASCFRSFFS